MKEPEVWRSVSFSIGQNMYTPWDKERSDLIRDDRPYAGVTCAAAGLHAKNSHCMDSLELALGIIGPHSYAGEVQEEVHKLIGSTVPRGRDNQLKDEPIGYYVLPFTRGALGNTITCGSTELQIRFGWNLPNDFGISRIHPGLDSKASSDGRDLQLFMGSMQFGFYVFASAEFTSGLSMTVGRINLSFANVYQTEEFQGQRHNQNSGSITFSFSF
jgi:lipid A 3-O-deacylase